MTNPTHQFEVKKIIEFHALGYDLSFTNSALFMLLSVFLFLGFLHLATKKRSIIPGRLQLLAENLYDMISGMLSDNIGKDHVKQFAPAIFSLFCFIIGCNLIGLVPNAFTATSHIIVTFAMASIIFVFIIFYGFWLHGLHFFSLFLPKGVPNVFIPLIAVIELFAFLARPFSLSLRLAANMMVGHILLKVIIGFIVAMGVFGVAPFGFSVIIFAFEVFVAILQAYIFTVLTCVYLNDAINLH